MTDESVTTLTVKSIIAWVLLVFGSLTLHAFLANVALIGTICLTFYTLYRQVKRDRQRDKHKKDV